VWLVLCILYIDLPSLPPAKLARPRSLPKNCVLHRAGVVGADCHQRHRLRQHNNMVCSNIAAPARCTGKGKGYCLHMERNFLIWIDLPTSIHSNTKMPKEPYLWVFTFSNLISRRVVPVMLMPKVRHKAHTPSSFSGAFHLAGHTFGIPGPEFVLCLGLTTLLQSRDERRDTAGFEHNLSELT
jgi:hypothetical protein